MLRPKKVTLLASDGKKYPFLCKSKDELRKDGRLMDFNRVCLLTYLNNANLDSINVYLSERMIISLMRVILKDPFYCAVSFHF